MFIVKVSPKGHILLPAPVRRRLGLNAGAKLALLEPADEAGTLRLKVLRSTEHARELAGMIAPATGRPPSLSTLALATPVQSKRR